MRRVNKTQANLERVWKQLDEASGSLYNALDALSCMVDLDDTTKRLADMIDITRIDLLKSEIEELLNKKGASL